MVAKGQAKDAYGGNAPRAARMKKMIYDCSIEESAMRHAKRCVFAHSPAHTRENLGENLYYTSDLRLDKIQAAEQNYALQQTEAFRELKLGLMSSLSTELDSRMFSQNSFGADLTLKSDITLRQGNSFTTFSLNEFDGDCFEMVWQDTYKLGCHVEWCSSMTYVVCQYGPKGNWLGNIVYEIGNSCATDDDCKCENCKCSKEEALCIVQ
ncbi:SCP-like protein [Ancylostoma duodenale]|uniref:SCP-like protein n=1 Tax=Ancylostoma duodenale TaxID=51022 RepID=A0A0C2H2Z3_9BILA|nr:SCP-like protein [Ancylostoma duodenale]